MSKTAKKSISILTTVATTVWMTGVGMVFALPVGATTIVDGDIIKNPNAEGLAQFDIYIVKLVGAKKFKRLVLSPHVFDSYGHLEWGNVKSVDAATMDSYTTSELVREINDTKVYKLTPSGDTGTKQWVNMTPAEFEADGNDWDSIYIINGTDRDAYTTGSDYTGGGSVTPPVTSTGTLTVSLAADTPASGIAVENAARYPFTKINLTATGGDVVVDTMSIERTGLAQDASISSVDVIDAGTNLPVNATSKTFNSIHRAVVSEDVTILSGTTKSLYLTGNMPSSLDSYSGEAPSLSLAELTVKDSATLNASFPITGNPQTMNHTITIGTATVQRGAYTNASSTSIEVGKEDYTFFSFQVQAGSTEKVEFSQVKVYQEGSASLGTDLVNLELFQDGTKIADGVILTSKYAIFNFDTITLDKGQTAQFQVKADVDDGSARTIDLGIYRTTDMLVKGVTYGYNITPTYTSTGASGGNPVLSDNEFTISNGTLQVTRSNTVAAANIGVNDDQWLGAYEFVCKGEAVDISSLVLTITSTGNPGNDSDSILGVELVNATTGETVAGPTDPARTTGIVTWSDTFTVPVGTTVYKVRGDLQTSADWASNDTLYVSFTPSAMTITGEITGNSITASPASAVQGNTQTIKAAALTVTRNTLPADASIIVNQKDLVLSSWNFDATASGEDVRVTSVLWAGKGWAATNTDALTTFIDENKNGIWDEGVDTALSPINDDLTTSATIGAASSTFAFTDPIIITKGTSVHIALKGDKDTVTSNATENWGLGDATASVIAYGASTGNTLAETITVDHGPTLTSRAKGTLTVETYNNPSSAIVLAGSTGNTFTNVKFTAKYEDLDVDELVIYLADGSHSFSTAAAGEYRDVTNVAIYDGTTKLGEASLPSTSKYTFSFDKGTITIPQGALNSKVLTVKADMATINPDTDNAPGTANADVKIGIGGTDGVKTTGLESNSEITGTGFETYRSSTSSAMVLRSGQPIVTLPTASNSLGASTALSNGNIPIYAVKITADAAGSSILMYRLSWIIATSGTGMSVTNVRVDDSHGNILKAASSSLTSWNLNNNNEYKIFTATFNNPNFSNGDNKEAIEITAGESETFYLYAQVSGASSNETLTTFLVGDNASTSGNVNLTNYADSSTTCAATAGWKSPNCDADYGNAQSANFVWSDNWKQYSISGAMNATSAAQWYNGYLVSGLGKKVSTTPYTIEN